MRCEHALLRPDFIYWIDAPTIEPIGGVARAHLFRRLEGAMDDLLAQGIDGLTAELILDMAYGPADSA